MSTNTNSSRIDRRTFLKGIGATGAAGVGLASTRGPVGDAEAIAPAVLVGVTAAAGGAAAYDWLLRDYIVDGGDSPSEGLSAGALEQSARETARTRTSTNGSTFIQNKNLIDGSKHVAYTEGKIDGIDALNEQESQSDVEDAVTAAVDEYETTILSNLIKGWNESVYEYLNLTSLLEDHSDTEFDEVLSGEALVGGSDHLVYDETLGNYEEDPKSHTLPNGDVIDVERFSLEIEFTNTADNNSTGTREKTFPGPVGDVELDEDSGSLHIEIREFTERYLDVDEWQDLYQDITDAFADVRDGLTLWVDNVYSDVQSGEIDVEELITPREQAAMMAEDESMAQAIADLAALNIPVDVEREATIYLPHVDATIRGTLGITQDQPIESGQTYDPDEDIDGSVYLTYDVSLGEGTWGAYETGVDGGEVTFTDEPWPGTIYRLDTTAGETVELVDDDFTAVDADGNEVDDWEDPDRWIVDISDDVDDAITEVDEVRYYAAEDETRFETIQLQNEFTVERIEDTSTGDEVDSMDFESSEPQSDDNYITQEEWDDMAAENERLIEKFEESQDSGGGIGLPGFGDGDLGPAGAVVGVGIAAAVLGGIIQVAKLYLPGN